MAKNYCVCILLNKTLDKTLLIKKAKGKLFEGMFNGLGGKLDEGETPKEACIREIHEESAELIKLKNPVHLTTFHFPHEEPIFLHAFYDIVDEVELPEIKEGLSFWKPVEFLLDFNNEKLVGYGNLSYLCRLALRHAKEGSTM